MSQNSEKLVLSRELQARSYNFSAKTGIKRLKSTQVYARSGGAKLLKNQISQFESRKQWEQFGFTVLKSSKKRALVYAKELYARKSGFGEECASDVVAVLGEISQNNSKKLLVVKKSQKMGKILKKWEEFRNENMKTDRKLKKSYNSFKAIVFI